MGILINKGSHVWTDVQQFNNEPVKFVCGYCNTNNSSTSGYRLIRFKERDFEGYGLFICTGCQKPTFIDTDGSQYPNRKLLEEIKHLDNDEIELLWREARETFQINCFHASIMVCRKIVMNVAFDKSENKKEVIKSFKSSINFLSKNGFTPIGSDEWVDEIRLIGNMANHEIKKRTSEEAKSVLRFTQALLIYVYELPNMHKAIKRQEND